MLFMRIKIKPLRTIEDANISIVSSKEYFIEPSQMDDLMDRLLEIAGKNPNVIIAQGLGEKPSSISTVLRNSDNIAVALPEPNLVLVYFRIAHENIEVALEKQALFHAAEKNTPSKFDALSEYLTNAITAVTFLMITIEALMNQIIPDNIKVWHKGKNIIKNEVEWLDIGTKLKVVLPKIKRIKFHSLYPVEFANIMELKEIRNSLVHLKTNTLANMTSYQSLIQTLLSFEFEKYAMSVKTLIDTIDVNLITEE